EVVGGDDGYEIDALRRGERCLALGHRLVAVVHTARIEMQLASLRARLVRIRRERAGDELGETIECGGAAVHRTDECAGPTADHAEAKLARESHLNRIAKVAPVDAPAPD